VTLSTGPSNRRRPRVLVVDDEPRLRALMLDVIPDMGFDVVAARSAEEALRLVDGEDGPPDIAILDLQLPLMQGMDLFATLRQRHADMQVIVLTGYGDLTAARGAIRLEVADFLTKPCHLNDLEQALDRARRRIPQPVPTPLDMVPTRGTVPGVAVTMAQVEREQIIQALARHAGNRTRAAEELGISRRTLHYRLKEYGIGG
jgi:two-component system response regulator RegA